MVTGILRRYMWASRQLPIDVVRSNVKRAYSYVGDADS